MLALATEDETLPWPKTRVGVFDQDGIPDFQGSADSSWDYAEENGVGFSRNAPDHIVQLEPVAELDGAGTVVSRFVYGTKSHSPDYMTRGGRTYRIVSDHLGSPRMVIDVDSGAVVQEMRFDEWGVLVEDTNPGWQPFGFAGGVWDPDTELVRFGARDYTPSEGRWTTKDPIGLGARAYNYANDPINFLDVTGLTEMPAVEPNSAPWTEEPTLNRPVRVAPSGPGVVGPGIWRCVSLLGLPALIAGGAIYGNYLEWTQEMPYTRPIDTSDADFTSPCAECPPPLLAGPSGGIRPSRAGENDSAETERCLAIAAAVRLKCMLDHAELPATEQNAICKEVERETLEKCKQDNPTIH